ncbi:MAG TPA: SUMF1/EgtB/PvdO family nonheme iron enzyme [Flavilitoribacter sp.]|nr:SUMF1/EgtB/PvdO family nonheme iron enzyme [Flavilitoribacter sp.]HMQ87635.1 SUMF1/EgtB/PvdO family nonheme iron enzyme [Flavilitoribacter sp.]
MRSSHFAFLAGTVTLLALSAFMLPGDAQDIEKQFARVNGRLYVQKAEVSNTDYQAFLTDLAKNGKWEAVKKYRVDSTGWALKTRLEDAGFWAENYHSDKKFGDYPVVNISLEAAQAYGAWLTERYMREENRTFPSVAFRLPSEAEWKLIALSAQAYSVDPRESAKKKSKKNMTANLRTGAGKRKAGKAPVTMKVDGSKANKLGLFHMVGNVCEMTRSGALKGGSWDTVAGESAVHLSQKYELPNPRVGFRLVMEMVER